MSDPALDALRADVARHQGPARARPLVALGQTLADRYWQAGPGQPGAVPYLDEAISAFDEAHPLLEAGSHMRAQVATQLGWLLGIRHLAHHHGEQDRERGIRVLEEARAMSGAGGVPLGMSRLILGQLYLGRVTGGLRDQNALMATMMRQGRPAAGTADIDRAAEAFREVGDDPAAQPQMRSAAATMLQITDVLRTLLGGFGGPGGFDLAKMMQAMATMQTMQTTMPTAGLPLGGMPNLFGADAMAQTTPLDRPAIVIDAPETMPETTPASSTSVPPTAPPRGERPAAAPRAGAAELRRALLAKLPGPDPESIRGLIDPATPSLDVRDVDDLVALGSALVDAPDVDDADHLLFALALHLRSRVDDGGWGSGHDSDDTDDVHAAGTALIMAAPGLTAADAATVGLAVALADLLDDRAPGRGIRDRLAEGFAAVTAALGRVGASALTYPTGRELLFLDAGTGRFAAAAPDVSPPARVFVVGDDPASLESTVSHVRSGAQLVALAGRTRRPLSVKPVFVANPRGDRAQAGFDALMLRRTFYPHAVGLGDTLENSAGKGTPDDVRAALDASLLHLGCGVTADGDLELAGPAVLDHADIAAGAPAADGGLAVLPPAGRGTPALVDALLATRCSGAIGLRGSLTDRAASLVYAVLHTELVDRGRSPADAVQATRTWLADPDRTLPDHLAGPYAAFADEPVDPSVIVHYGL